MPAPGGALYVDDRTRGPGARGRGAGIHGFEHLPGEDTPKMQRSVSAPESRQAAIPQTRIEPAGGRDGERPAIPPLIPSASLPFLHSARTAFDRSFAVRLARRRRWRIRPAFVMPRRSEHAKPGGRGRLPARGSHRAGRARFEHQAPRTMDSLRNGTHCAPRTLGEGDRSCATRRIAPTSSARATNARPATCAIASRLRIASIATPWRCR